MQAAVWCELLFDRHVQAVLCARTIGKLCGKLWVLLQWTGVAYVERVIEITLIGCSVHQKSRKSSSAAGLPIDPGFKNTMQVKSR